MISHSPDVLLIALLLGLAKAKFAPHSRVEPDGVVMVAWGSMMCLSKYMALLAHALWRL
jgi:hypothetical protein